MSTLQDELRDLLNDERKVNNALNLKIQRGHDPGPEVKKIKVYYINRAIKENPFVNIKTLVKDKFFMSWPSYYEWAKEFGIPTVSSKSERALWYRRRIKELSGMGIKFNDVKMRVAKEYKEKMKSIDRPEAKATPSRKPAEIRAAKPKGFIHVPNDPWTKEEKRKLFEIGEPMFKSGMKMFAIDQKLGVPIGSFSRIRREFTGSGTKIVRSRSNGRAVTSSIAAMLRVVEKISVSKEQQMEMENALLRELLKEKGVL